MATSVVTTETTGQTWRMPTRRAETVVGRAAPKPNVPKKGAEGPQVYQDFRGSRFDIQQAFSGQ